MVEKPYEIVWTKRSQQHMRKIHDYISKDSDQNAKKVVEDIALSVNKATNNPQFYPPDKYKQENDGSYRAFEMHHYRVSYRVTKKEIRVLMVRHTSREPKEY